MPKYRTRMPIVAHIQIDLETDKELNGAELVRQMRDYGEYQGGGLCHYCSQIVSTDLEIDYAVVDKTLTAEDIFLVEEN